MTLTEAQTTKPATDALSQLVDTARDRARGHRNGGRTNLADQHDHIAQTLDRCRTRLVQDGVEYLDVAWAFVDGGRKAIARLVVGGAS